MSNLQRWARAATPSRRVRWGSSRWAVKTVSPDNRQHGPCPGAEVLGCGGHLSCAIGLKSDLGRSPVAMGRIQGRGHSRPDQPIAVPHAGRLRGPLGPSKFFRAQPVTLHQMLRRPRDISARVHFRIVLDPQFNGVDTRFNCKFVHGALEREHPGSASRSAHKRRSTHIPRHKRVADLDIGRLIEQPGCPMRSAFHKHLRKRDRGPNIVF